MSTNFTNRERILATLAGKILDYVPSWTQGFFNAATVHRLMPTDLITENFKRFSADIPYDFSPQSLPQVEKLIAFNRHNRSGSCGCWLGTQCLWSRGPGEFNGWVIEKTAGRQIDVGKKLAQYFSRIS